MKYIVPTVISFCSLIAPAQASEFKLPAQVSCQSLGDCTSGYPQFCESSTYFPMIVEDLAAHFGELYDPSGLLSESELAGKIKIDFTDGDQYSFYFFNVEDMKALAEGRVDSIQGTYEDGFDWVDGYNTRAKFTVECSTPRL